MVIFGYSYIFIFFFIFNYFKKYWNLKFFITQLHEAIMSYAKPFCFTRDLNLQTCTLHIYLINWATKCQGQFHRIKNSQILSLTSTHWFLIDFKEGVVLHGIEFLVILKNVFNKQKLKTYKWSSSCCPFYEKWSPLRWKLRPTITLIKEVFRKSWSH